MRLFGKLVLLLGCLSLVACATETGSGTKLVDSGPPPVQVRIVEIRIKDPVRVVIPVETIEPEDGLLPVQLALLAINLGTQSVNVEQRKDRTQKLKDSLDKTQFALPGKAYAETIRQAKWLKIDGITLYQVTDNARIDADLHKTRQSQNGKAMGVFATEYIFGPYYETMTQNMRFQISTIEKARAKAEIYNISLSSTYKLETGQKEDLDNYKRWTNNDNALFKQAIRETTADINTQLRNMLSDPLMKKEDSPASPTSDKQ